MLDIQVGGTVTFHHTTAGDVAGEVVGIDGDTVSCRINLTFLQIRHFSLSTGQALGSSGGGYIEKTPTGLSPIYKLFFAIQFLSATQRNG